jgi:hypothetical protein
MSRQQPIRWWDGSQYQWGYWAGSRWVTTAYETKGKGKGKSSLGLPKAEPATEQDQSGKESHRKWVSSELKRLSWDRTSCETEETMETGPEIPITTEAQGNDGDPKSAKADIPDSDL